ncbi:MAG: hypothetical protein KKC75_01255 [Nanoarchaeota archaeon]|nr:hypothetical protein [Nanoarchaeota archaeon]MBU1004418.1 hypothetical protein [Nanoarchaeota archaeon]MBU1946695.1 hypothetical protein [Nanoarchaeota archaeon]
MITKDDLIAWLKCVDKKLKRKMTIIAVGGTAMTLIGLKSSTRDVDFCLHSDDKNEFKKAIDNKFIVDLFVDGYIFSEQLPPDYLEKSTKLIEMEHIELRALDKADIIITKAARLNARDEEDIKALAKYVNKEELIKRFNDVLETYAGNEEDFKYHFSLIVKRFFN